MTSKELVKALTNLSHEDIEVLKSIAAGSYKSPNPNDNTRNYMSLMSQVFGRSFMINENSAYTRLQYYQIYDEMDDTVAYISAALDIISDDATQPDSNGMIIKVVATSEKVQNITQDLIDRLEIEEKLAQWARVIAKYGDFFLQIHTSEGKGITRVRDNIYPSWVERKDYDGELVAFTGSEESLNGKFYAPWDYVHFRHKAEFSKYDDRINNLNNDVLDDHDLTSYYGQSILRSAIKVYSQLRFVENMILLSRLTNSIRRNIFMINVGDVSPDKAFETVKNYADLLKKDIALDLDKGIYDSQKKTMTYDEDIFLPVSDTKNDVRLETVGGDVNIAEQYDLEYLLNKLFSALKIPKAYLNYEQDLNARSTLIQLDIRYARMVARLQQTLRGGLLRLCRINLALCGIDPDSVDLDIQLTPVSTIDTEAKSQEIKSKLDVANSLWSTLNDINEKLSPQQSGGGMGGFMGMMDSAGSDPSAKSETPVDLMFAAETIFTEYLDLPAEVVSRLLRKEDEKPSKDSSAKSAPSKKVTFRKANYPGADLNSSYPTAEGREDFQRLHEELLMKKASKSLQEGKNLDEERRVAGYDNSKIEEVK